MGTVHERSGSREVEGDRVVIGPEVYRLTAEVTTIVIDEPRRNSSVDREPIQHGDDILTTKALAHLDSQMLARAAESFDRTSWGVTVSNDQFRHQAF
mgnify:FL=1